LVLELPLTLILGSRIFGQGMHWREWGSAAVMMISLGAVLFLLSPAPSSNGRVHWYGWVLGITVNLAAVGALVLLGRRKSARGSGSAYRAALLGIAAGSMFGLTAALMKGMTKTFSHGIMTLFTSWEIYGMVAAGLLGMFLIQSALNAGGLIAAQPGLTLADPVISVLRGVFALHEEVRGGWYILPEVAAAAILGAAVLTLARSPLLAEAAEELIPSHLAAHTKRALDIPILLGIVCNTSHKEKIMTRTSTQDLQEEFLTSLRKGQKTIIGALRIWVDTVTTVTPRLLPLTDKLPKLPNVTVPFAGKLPTPEETVDSAYDLAEQLLANQRKFADDVLALTIPLMSGRHKNGTTRTAPKPEPKVVQVTPEPKPALVLGPKPAAPKPEPKPAAVASAPKPAAVAKPEPKPAAVAKPEPKPAAVAKPEPKPAAVAKPEPKPAAVASAPKPAAPKPEPKPAVVAAEPKPAAPKPAVMASAPKPAVAKPEPKPAAVASAPKPAAPKPEPEPKPAAVAEPKPAVAKTEPKPAVASEPKPAPVKSPAPKAAAPKAAAPKAAAPRSAAPRSAAPKTTAAKSAPRPAAKRTPKAAG
jgi:hypothetical protein